MKRRKGPRIVRSHRIFMIMSFNLRAGQHLFLKINALRMEACSLIESHDFQSTVASPIYVSKKHSIYKVVTQVLKYFLTLFGCRNLSIA